MMTKQTDKPAVNIKYENIPGEHLLGPDSYSQRITTVFKVKPVEEKAWYQIPAGTKSFVLNYNLKDIRDSIQEFAHKIEQQTVNRNTAIRMLAESSIQEEHVKSLYFKNKSFSDAILDLKKNDQHDVLQAMYATSAVANMFTKHHGKELCARIVNDAQSAYALFSSRISCPE